MEVNHEFLSASEYAKRTGIGEEEVKKQIRIGYLEGFITEGGHYKVKVYKNDSIPLRQYEETLKRAVEAETKLNNIKSVLI